MAALLSPEQIDRLEAKIGAVERLTTAELRIAIARPSWLGIRRKARKLFERHGLTATPDRNAVLVVLDPKSHELVIYGDEGISSRTSEHFWDDVRDAMIGELREGRIADALSLGIRLLGEELSLHFPSSGNRNGAHSNAIIFE